MVYIPPDVRDAVEHLAVDERRLDELPLRRGVARAPEARGRQIVEDLAAPPPNVPSSAELAIAIELQDKRIEELRAAIDGIHGGDRRGGTGPAGTKVAEAM